jgi:hypothetical protein
MSRQRRKVIEVTLTHDGVSVRQHRMEPSARSLAAERMRRHRERRRDGLRCLTIELRETEIWTLVNKGLLKYETRNNVEAIRGALYKLLDDTLA